MLKPYLYFGRVEGRNYSAGGAGLVDITNEFCRAQTGKSCTIAACAGLRRFVENPRCCLVAGKSVRENPRRVIRRSESFRTPCEAPAAS